MFLLQCKNGHQWHFSDLENAFMPCIICEKSLKIMNEEMTTDQYIWYYNQAKAKLHSYSNEDIVRFIEEKLAEVDAARHTIRERTGKIEVLPKLSSTEKKTKKLDFDSLIDEIFD